MLALTHTVVGLWTGIFWQNPVIIFVAAFVFHFALDAVYHWNIYPDDQGRFPFGRVALDVGSGLVLTWLLLGERMFSLPILTAIAGSNAPDVIYSIWHLWGKPRSKKFSWLTSGFDLHKSIQWETRHVTRGLMPQIILILLVVWWLRIYT